jgi:hypothetical protein
MQRVHTIDLTHNRLLLFEASHIYDACLFDALSNIIALWTHILAMRECILSSYTKGESFHGNASISRTWTCRSHLIGTLTCYHIRINSAVDKRTQFREGSDILGRKFSRDIKLVEKPL